MLFWLFDLIFVYSLCEFFCLCLFYNCFFTRKLILATYVTHVIEKAIPTAIEEESAITPVIDERRGVVKAPTSDEEAEIKRRKEEAYLLLAQQMEVHVQQDDPSILIYPTDEPAGTITMRTAQRSRKTHLVSMVILCIHQHFRLSFFYFSLFLFLGVAEFFIFVHIYVGLRFACLQCHQYCLVIILKCDIWALILTTHDHWRNW